MSWLREHRSRLQAAFALLALAAGGLLTLIGAGGAGDKVWAAAVVIPSVELLGEVIHTVFVDRRMGVDTIALVSPSCTNAWRTCGASGPTSSPPP